MLPYVVVCSTLVSTTKSAARVPRRFDADHPDLDWINLKSFLVARGLIEPPTQEFSILPPRQNSRLITKISNGLVCVSEGANGFGLGTVSHRIHSI